MVPFKTLSVVDTIYNRLDRKQIHIPANITGMDVRYEEINSLLKQSEAQFLVICGMAGSGKSTMAQFIVYSEGQQFESNSIVEKIGTRCKNSHEMVVLQEQLCSDISKGKLDRRIDTVCKGTAHIEVLLEKTKALIVLDEIVEERHLEELLGSGIINKESKIIITTNSDISNWFMSRSMRFHKYIMRLLNDDEALELLSLHAFRSKLPKDGYTELAQQVVRYCGGNPLSLEVLGSSLSEKDTITSWKSELSSFEKSFDDRMYEAFIRSYNSLPSSSEKELFLHIACFFVGRDMNYVVKILEPDYGAESKINTLTRRCFLYVTPDNKLMMHRLLQEMGRSLVDRESRIISERTRVWRNKDSYEILRRKKISNTIEGLALDIRTLVKEDGFESRHLKELSTDSLQQMDQLKLLQLKFVKLTGSYEDLSENLRWLYWVGFNKSTVPTNIYMGNMVALDMSYSYLKEFEPPMCLPSLKILNLKDSLELSEIRGFHEIPNLETLILWNCHNLVRVCRTIGNLERLVLLNMTGCEKLFSRVELSFPLPRSLQRAFLNECNLECTDYFPLSFSDQSFLQYINLANGHFESLPSYKLLKNLRVLDLRKCSRLKRLLCLPSTLAELYIYDCESIEKITFESGRFTLQEFGYEGCVILTEIEGWVKLLLITKLDESDLGHMFWLKDYQDQEVCLVGDELTEGRSRQLQMLYEFNIMSTSLPDIKHPQLTTEYTSRSTSLSFDVPLCPRRCRIKGLNVTFRYTISGNDWVWYVKIRTTNVDLMYYPKVFGKPGSGNIGRWLSYWPIGNLLDVGAVVNVSIVVLSGLEVLECGASLVYTDDDVVRDPVENKTGWVEAFGEDLYRFKLRNGSYYLCQRDIYKLTQVGRLPPGWLSTLAGYTIDDTEVRGWRMTGRPQQSYQSFKELKTIRCIIHGPDTWKNLEHLKIGLNDIEMATPNDCLNEEQSQRLNVDEIVPKLEKALELQLENQNAILPSPYDFAHLKIPLESILCATNNFAEENCIYTRRFAKEYNGCLLWSGELIDITANRWNKERKEADQEFWMEISMLSSLKHKNMVSLVGFCDENDEKIIIIKHEMGGSLDYYLSDPNLLTWMSRLEICIGIAHALSYIHYDEPRDFSVIHRNINSCTILLNDDMEPKLSNFQHSMKIKASERHHSFRTDSVWSMKGYTDPTNIETGSVNYKSDIYSFGMVLFELLCGRKSVIDDQDNKYLAPVAISHYIAKILEDIIDPDLWKQMDPQSLNIFAETAYDCLNEERSQRPNIDEIVTRLQKSLELQLESENTEHSIVGANVEGTSSTHDEGLVTYIPTGVKSHVSKKTVFSQRSFSIKTQCH